jgi:hypothetical protein
MYSSGGMTSLVVLRKLVGASEVKLALLDDVAEVLEGAEAPDRRVGGGLRRVREEL